MNCPLALLPNAISGGFLPLWPNSAFDFGVTEFEGVLCLILSRAASNPETCLFRFFEMTGDCFCEDCLLTPILISLILLTLSMGLEVLVFCELACGLFVGPLCASIDCLVSGGRLLEPEFGLPLRPLFKLSLFFCSACDLDEVFIPLPKLSKSRSKSKLDGCFCGFVGKGLGFCDLAGVGLGC